MPLSLDLAHKLLKIGQAYVQYVNPFQCQKAHQFVQIRQIGIQRIKR